MNTTKKNGAKTLWIKQNSLVYKNMEVAYKVDANSQPIGLIFRTSSKIWRAYKGVDTEETNATLINHFGSRKLAQEAVEAYVV